jgi:hypothetical protein
MNYLKTLVVVSVLFFAGCASNPMNVTKNTEVSPTSADEAQVVFMRSSFLGSAINASLFDVTHGEPVFIGIIANDTKVPYKTTPGKHTFMVVSEAADFLEADIVAGKNYYSIVTPRMGAWKARFSLWPISNDPAAKFTTGSKDFSEWQEETFIAETTEKANAWYQKNKVSVTKKQAKYWPVWLKKSAEDLDKRTLKQEDGL